jgi:ABC-type Mn2+/Zn2+ transport system permease subunit
MSSDKKVGGIFGGLLGISKFLGFILISIIIYLLTGRNYAKNQNRFINLTIGTIILSILISFLQYYINTNKQLDSDYQLAFFLTTLLFLSLITILASAYEKNQTKS